MSLSETRGACDRQRWIAPGELRIAFAARSASAGLVITPAKSRTRNCQSSSARICCGA